MDIPPQQWDQVKKDVAFVLCCVNARQKTPLPPELLALIMKHVKWGFTLDEALAHRLALMQERKYFVGANNKLWEREFSFCEH